MIKCIALHKCANSRGTKREKRYTFRFIHVIISVSTSLLPSAATYLCWSFVLGPFWAVWSFSPSPVPLRLTSSTLNCSASSSLVSSLPSHSADLRLVSLQNPMSQFLISRVAQKGPLASPSCFQAASHVTTHSTPIVGHHCAVTGFWDGQGLPSWQWVTGRSGEASVSLWILEPE